MQAESLPRVLHVVHSLTCGGTERALVSLLRQFGEIAASHCIATLRQAGPLAIDVPECVSIHALNLDGRVRTAFLSLARICRRVQADIIHARNAGTWLDAMIAGVLTGTPTVLGFQGWDKMGRFDDRTRRRIQWALRFGAQFTSVSRLGIKDLHEQCGVPLERIIHLPNGVNVKMFEYQDENGRRGMRDALGASTNDILIGSVGTLRTIKGFHVLLSALNKCKDSNSAFRLAIAGDGPERGALETMSHELGIADRVLFIGHCSDVPSFLRALDVYVCCSLGEGMSNALLEAMAAGLPIVATDVGDNTTMIRNGIDGIIIPPGDSDTMALTLHTQVRDEDLRMRLAVAARHRAANFDLGKMAGGYESLYRNMVEARKSKGQPQFVTAATAY
ncbi:MAG: glycosyltransferase [Planctomycetes bacterium]|nr:glycosyltransferase [Planctomycetota bacterium]